VSVSDQYKRSYVSHRLATHIVISVICGAAASVFFNIL